MLTQAEYKLWRGGKAYAVYFEGENRSNYDFSISPSPKDLGELLFLVEGENRAVRISATVRWMGIDLLSRFFNIPAMIFILYGIPCAAGGLILIFLFRGYKTPNR